MRNATGWRSPSGRGPGVCVQGHALTGAELHPRAAAQKRGSELTFTTLNEERAGAVDPLGGLDALDTALGELEPVLAQLVDLRFFCGFSVEEIAAMRGRRCGRCGGIGRRRGCYCIGR